MDISKHASCILSSFYQPVKVSKIWIIVFVCAKFKYPKLSKQSSSDTGKYNFFILLVLEKQGWVTIFNEYKMVKSKSWVMWNVIYTFQTASMTS